MPRSTSLETAVSLSLLLGFTACSFGGSDGEASDDKLAFTFLALEGLKYGDARNFTAPMTVIDTSDDSSCSEIIPADATGTPELCVISAENITIDRRSTVRAIGRRPLVLASSGNLQVGGTIDASSARATMSSPEMLGAGSPSVTCTPFAREGGSLATGGGGGGGGSFVGAGGNGGDGSVGGAALGGMTNPKSEGPTIQLRGGCRGQIGGGAADHPQGQPPGAGGAGGGALYLAAGGNLQILEFATIAANGAGGGGGGAQSGGGGGGSGGVVVVEALGSITYTGFITAKGGGGGGGGHYRPNDTTQYPGTPGADGSLSPSAAVGGEGRPVGSGNGAASVTDYQPAPNGSPSSYGGGGGGGGSGWIHFVSPDIDDRGTFAPPRR